MGAWGYSRRRNALEKMEAILLRMENEYAETQEADVRPNTVSYVTVSELIGVLLSAIIMPCRLLLYSLTSCSPLSCPFFAVH